MQNHSEQDTDPTKTFSHIVQQRDYPMVIVTAMGDGEHSGCLVGLNTQCSIHPPRMMVCISKRNHTFEVALKSTHLAVHFLAEDERELAYLFGHETGDRINKFSRCSWTGGPGGVPVLTECKRWIAGPIVDRVDAGDHMAFIISPDEAHCEPGEVAQLNYQKVKSIEPGHLP